MMPKALTILLVSFVFFGAAAAPTVEPTLDQYRSWEELTSEPKFVPYELAIQCAIPTKRQVELAREKYGTHYGRYIRVYANPAAASALRSDESKTFPEGSVIAKEKLSTPDDPRPEGVAFMVKRAMGQFPESDGWEFLYRPAGTAKASFDGCIRCHRVGGRKDYVFSQYVPRVTR